MNKKNDVVFTLYDDEPSPFDMSEEEYEKANAEYNKKVMAELKKLDEWRKTHKLKK